MKPIVADIHAHSTVRLFYGEHGIMWKKPLTDAARHHQTFTLPQAVFGELLESRVRLVFLSLYAIEQGFLSNLIPEKDMLKALKLSEEGFGAFLIKTLDHLINKEQFGFDVRGLLAKYIDGIARKKYKMVVAGDADYFNQLSGEYHYLVDKIQNDKDGAKHLYIAGSFDDVSKVLNVDADMNCNAPNDEVIVIVLTVEGGHSLGCGMSKANVFSMDELNGVKDGQFIHKRVQQLYEQLKNNIATLKQWGGGKHSPLFITFAHHFWNQLGGHNMSVPAPMHVVFDQNQGMNTPMTELGKKVISELLSTDNGRRILIDTKHMSVDVKKWYYDFVETYNAAHPAQLIPIISSHSGVNGWKTMEASRNTNDHAAMSERYKNTHLVDTGGMFNNWDINLSDEEINIIHRSGGLIGLNFDQRILSGPQMVSYIEKFDIQENIELFRSVWAEPIIANILHIAKAVFEGNNAGKEKIWEMIAIGSDFDGMINPLDAWCYPFDFEKLSEMLKRKLNERKAVEALLARVDVEQLVDGFMYKNALRFLKKYFNN
ncbi:MAG: membrane dipeptidase [Bacteroidota bacterium]